MTSLLDPVLNPILNMVAGDSILGPFYLILIFSFLISLVISVVYKLMTDQDLMRSLKSEMKELQKEMKTLRKDPEKLMQVQKKSMETNMKYMTKSFKPTLITLIPIIIIFGWMSSHLAYYPIMENDSFTTTITLEEHLIGQNISIDVPIGINLTSSEEQLIESNTVSWVMKGKMGTYSLIYLVDDKSYEKEVIISDKFGDYAEVEKIVKDDTVQSITVSNEAVKPIRSIGLGFIPWIGNFGWLGCYIILSIIFSITIRKIMKIA